MTHEAISQQDTSKLIYSVKQIGERKIKVRLATKSKMNVGDDFESLVHQVAFQIESIDAERKNRHGYFVYELTAIDNYSYPPLQASKEIFQEYFYK